MSSSLSSPLPSLPLPVRLLNVGMTCMGPLGKHLIGLSPEQLMRHAARKTGLNDFGSDYFRYPLQRLCHSLENDAHLSGLGRLMARQEVLRLLGNRLKFIDIFKQHPEISDEKIVAPIFILGMPRTGTTSTHELMALDSQFRVPLSWEVASPFPPPETATYTTDSRIALCDQQLDKVDQLLPEFRNMHPMGAELPQECVALFSHDFSSMIFDTQFRLTQYQKWLVQEDMTEVFKNHRRWLQLLQWKCPGDTWVLKSPQYLWNIEDMLREYPDARVIHNHRDPIKVAMSIGSLVTTLRGMGAKSVDLPETTQSYADLLYYGTEKTMAARANGLLKSDRVIDIQFYQFREDPVAALEKVYDYFELNFNPAIGKKMQKYLNKAANDERHGKHEYTLESSELNLQAERARFARYQKVYNIPIESI